MDSKQTTNWNARVHKFCHSAIYRLCVMPSNNTDDDLATGRQAGQETSLEEDMGVLTEYLSGNILGSRTSGAQTVSSEEEVAVLTTECSEDDSDLEELLTRLDEADGMVTGVENRLDKILDKLDDLLIHLDSRDTNRPRTDDPGDSSSAKS